MSPKSFRCAIGAACLASVAFASGAHGAMIFLSSQSSDETPASVLNAMFEFEVAGSTLSFTAHNQTAAPAAYKINQLYFNGGGEVTGLTPVTIPTGWSFHTNNAAAGFGVFDFALIGGVGNNPAQIQHGASVSFVFTIHGAGVAEDFMSSHSSIPPGNMPGIVAAKFVQGPGDDGAFGAHVPAPSGIVALLLGVAPALRRRRR